MICDCKTTGVKVTRGNDFYLHVPVKMLVDGVEQDFDVSAASEYSVRLVGAYKRYVLTATLSGTSDIVARVEGDALPCGVYGIEVSGVTGGNDWRSMRCGELEIVECDCEADESADGGLTVETVAVVMGTVVAMTAAYADGYLTLSFPNMTDGGQDDGD